MTWTKDNVSENLWKNGRVFLMEGGPVDGMKLRLWPQHYPDSDTSGWDELTVGGVRYVRPDDVDPRDNPTSKAKKKLPKMVAT